MPDRSGYTIDSTLHEGVQTIIYRLRFPTLDKSAILKLLKSEYPTLEAITSLKHEYQIQKDLDDPNIVKAYSIETFDDRLGVLLEDFGGESLKQMLSTQKLSLASFLKIAVQLTQALACINKHSIIHKDIKPANIIINQTSGIVKLTDFSIASRLSQETAPPIVPDQIEGTLAYMSPEQTGRMNRTLDYLSDFYSLGVTFYEMLAGQLPFQSNDPLEIVYCHLAKQPVSVQQFNPEIPDAIASLVAKLMAKNAEDRYQSATGLLADLQKCCQILQNTGTIANFTPGELDILSQLRIPQKLYGREKQVNELLAAFERISYPSPSHAYKELILVSGYSGIGKSSVVNEINKPITRQRGYFISGKFDQFKRHIPYVALTQAFRSLMQQLLSENIAKVQDLRAKIITAVGSNGQVIIDVIPEVEWVIGKQPAVPKLEPKESQNRFNCVFQNFLGVFAQPKHPLVIFLDDLQWADAATLNSIQLLMADTEIHNLLIVGAYRDHEVSPTHPLMLTVAALDETGAQVKNIVLRSLNLADVTQLITETLDCAEQKEIQELAKLLFNKTGGNPFFLTQMLKMLDREKLLVFDFSQGRWLWSIEDILAVGIADFSVVELVARNIDNLPENTQEVLKLAACIGDRFSLDVLATVRETNLLTVATNLQPALESGLILPLNSKYRIPLLFATQELDGFVFDDSQVQYRFLHDRVQQAAYQLIPDAQKQAFHLKIGQLLLSKASQGDTAPTVAEEQIFDIVNQLNLGSGCIVKQADRDRLANLNLIAGKKAKTAAAYEAAARYFDRGRKMLAADSWDRQYDLTLALHLEIAETTYLTADYPRSDEMLNTIDRRGQNLLDRVQGYEIKIQSLIAQNQLLKAIATGIKVLNLLDISLTVVIDSSLANFNLLFQAELENLPIMTESHYLAAMRILKSIAAPAFIANPETYVPVILTMVELCRERGHSALSAFTYVSYGIVLCGVLGDLDAGYESGLIALKLLDKFQATDLKCKLYTIFNSFIRHWKEHAKETIISFQLAIHSGLETGDLEFTGYAAVHYSMHLFLTGCELSEVSRKQAEYGDLLVRIKQDFSIYYNKIWQQLTLNLQGQASHVCELIGDSFDETEMLPVLHETNNGTSLFSVYFAKLMLCYSFENYPEAIANAELAAKYTLCVMGMIPVVVHNFYHSLALLAQYPQAETEEQLLFLKQVEANQEAMQKWAATAPVNYLHKYQLVSAETARVLGQRYQAMDCYDEAIKRAAENGYIQEKALANELAAKFYLSLGKRKIAKVYMTEAYYGYADWGATAKVQYLEQNYGALILCTETKTDSSQQAIPTNISLASTRNHTTTSSNILDWVAVMKASEAIQNEIILDNLPRTLLHIVRESTGAQKGCIILKKDDRLFIEALDDGQEFAEFFMESTPVESSQNVPVSLINYVAITQQPLVINNVATESISQADPYFQRQQPKSAVCAPIFDRGELTGIFYLENNFTIGAFTIARLELLQLLTSQAAIAIKNARLYAREQQNSQQLQQSLLELQQTQVQLAHQKEQYRSIFESVTDGLYINDLDTGEIVKVNPAVLRIFGYSYEEFVRLSPTDYIHPDSLPLFASYLETLRADQLFQCQAVNMRKDGTLFDIEVLGTTCTYNGKRHGLAILRDISDRKRAEAALKQQELQYRSIFETANDGLGICDLETYKFIAVNPAINRMLGYRVQEWLNLEPTDYVHPDSLHLFGEFIEAVKAGEDFCCEAVVIRKDGTLLDIDMKATPYTYNGKPHALCITRDISDRKQAEAALKQQELQYRSIFEAANDGLAICDLETYKFIAVNPAISQMYGYQAQEWLNLEATDYLHPDSLHLFGEFIEAVKAGEDFCCEAVGIRKDGTLFDIDVKATAFTYNNKPHALCIARDISDRKQAEQTLLQSEQRFRNLFEATPKIAIQGYDRHRRVIAWNSASEILYGYSREEAVGKQIEDLIIPPTMREPVIQAIENWMANGIPIPPGELDLVCKDGSTVSVYSSQVLLANAAGEPEMYCVDIDLSDRKKAENALRKSENKLAEQKQTLKAILNAAPIWIWMSNLKNQIQFVNKTFCENVGIPVSRFIEAEHYRDFLGDETAANCTASDSACLAQETPHLSVELLPFVDGKIHNVEVTKAQIKDTQGQTIGIIGLGVDATERVQAKLMLQAQNQHLEQALQELQQAQTQLIQSEKMSSLGNLVAGVAHEINNPIGFLNGSISNIEEYIQYIFKHLECYQRCYPDPLPAIKESAEDIELEFLTEDLPKIFGSMKVAVDRIRNISTSLRTFSRADYDRKVACNIHEGIDSTLLILKYRLKANEQRPAIKIIKEYSDLPLIQCFPGQLNQVFMNLVANAIDAIEESNQGRSFAEIKAAPNTITVGTEISDDCQSIAIKIKDNGQGIPEVVKARIFDDLFTTKGVGKGTGLGLSISRQIVEETHGGTLTCDSVLGEGTEFAIALPIE